MGQGKIMIIEISKFCGEIFLDLQNNQGVYTSILTLSQGGIERCFTEKSTPLSLRDTI